MGISPPTARTFEWDARNQLVAVSSSLHHVEFAYDGLQRRTRAVEREENGPGSTTNSLWCGWKVCEDRTTQSAPTRSAFSRGEMSTDGPRFFPHDHIKSVREVLDGSAVLIGRYTYDPIGRRSVASGNDATRIAFTGLATSPNVGLYLAMYRVYDPNIGTWLSEDPLGLAVAPSLDVYASGNPISRVDRLGLAPQDWGEIVRGVRNVGPIDVWRGYQMSQDALADAERSRLPGLHNGPADAYRHCL